MTVNTIFAQEVSGEQAAALNPSAEVRRLASAIRGEYLRLRATSKYDHARFSAWVQPQVDQFDPQALSALEIEMLFSSRHWFNTDGIRSRLNSLSAGSGKDVSLALAMQALLDFPRGDYLRLAGESIGHSGYAAALADHPPPSGSTVDGEYSAAWDVLTFVPTFKDEQHLSIWRRLAKVQASLAAETRLDTIAHVRRLLYLAQLAGARIPVELHLRFATLAEARVERALLAETDDAKRAVRQRQLKALRQYMGRQRLIGQPAPNIEFIWNNIDGEPASLKELHGKIVVLSFWATTCGACATQYPALREIAEKYRDRDVLVLGVTSEGKIGGDALAKRRDANLVYAKARNFTWPIAFSTANVFDPRFGVFALPHLAIVDANGILRANGVAYHHVDDGAGGVRADLKPVEKMVDDLLERAE